MIDLILGDRGRTIIDRIFQRVLIAVYFNQGFMESVVQYTFRTWTASFYAAHFLNARYYVGRP